MNDIDERKESDRHRNKVNTEISAVTQAKTTKLDLKWIGTRTLFKGDV